MSYPRVPLPVITVAVFGFFFLFFVLFCFFLLGNVLCLGKFVFLFLTFIQPNWVFVLFVSSLKIVFSFGSPMLHSAANSSTAL